MRLSVGVTYILSTDGINYALGALFIVVAMNHEQGMDHARDPEQKRQDQIYHGLKWLAADQYGQGRKNYRQYISHYSTSDVKIDQARSSRARLHVRGRSRARRRFGIVPYEAQAVPHREAETRTMVYIQGGGVK